MDLLAKIPKLIMAGDALKHVAGTRSSSHLCPLIVVDVRVLLLSDRYKILVVQRFDITDCFSQLHLPHEYSGASNWIRRARGGVNLYSGITVFVDGRPVSLSDDA